MNWLLAASAVAAAIVFGITAPITYIAIAASAGFTVRAVFDHMDRRFPERPSQEDEAL